jgi:Ca2+-binding RTX toxin-like protein
MTAADLRRRGRNGVRPDQRRTGAPEWRRSTETAESSSNGGAFADAIRGRDGDDTIRGIATLTGGEGSDRCLFDGGKHVIPD